MSTFTIKILIIKILRSLILLYILLGAYGWFFSDSSIFFPPTPGYSVTPETIFINNGGQQKLAAIYYKNTSAKYTILYHHGNGSDIGYLNRLFKQFYQRGYSILAYDYSGYGLSSGTPSEQQTYKDATAAYDYLVNTLNTVPNDIVIYGHSLGAAIATDLASRKPSAALVLESPFLTAFRVRTKWAIYPFDKYSNINKIALVNTPVYIMHSRDDEIIPFWHGQQLYQHVSGDKEYYWLDSAGHNGIAFTGDAYWNRLNDFLIKLGES